MNKVNALIAGMFFASLVFALIIVLGYGWEYLLASVIAMGKILPYIIVGFILGRTTTKGTK